jgi:flagellar hook protein FlgE
MMRSLFSGVSGLKNHQTRMDVIGNNIANINTVGFKGSRVSFSDVLSQTIQGASGSTGNRGGTNPMQIGMGMGLASIDTVFTDGSFQPTGKGTDLSIQGQGFFILSDGRGQVYSRAGNFDFDDSGNYLVPGTGYKVMGWMADNTGAINTAGTIGPIQIPVGAAMAAKTTQQMDFANNLSASAINGTAATTSINVFDSLGISHKIVHTFTKESDNTWLYGTSVPDATGAVTGALGRIVFNSNGSVQTIEGVTATVPTAALTIPTFEMDQTLNAVHTQNFTVFDSNNVPHVFKATFTTTGATTWSYTLTDQANPDAAPAASGTINWNAGPGTYTGFGPLTYGGNTVNFNITAHTPPAGGAFDADATSPYTTTAIAPLGFTPAGGADPMSINLVLSNLTQFGGATTIQAVNQDGYSSGTLDTTTIDTTGVIIGRFTNGQSKNLGQVALATFSNPAGLNKVGSSLFAESNNSGVAQIGTAGSGGRGELSPGTLEMSNIDLAQEFSNMIITQRGFQANSKIITTTDEMLEQLANLRR